MGPCKNGQEAIHLNGDRKDNRRKNLIWGTSKENADDRLKVCATPKNILKRNREAWQRWRDKNRERHNIYKREWVAKRKAA